MQITALTYAAEAEQALTATAVLDQASTDSSVPWPFEALNVLAGRFGIAGENLAFEYQNDIYEIECGYPAPFVLFH